MNILQRICPLRFNTVLGRLSSSTKQPETEILTNDTSKRQNNEELINLEKTITALTKDFSDLDDKYKRALAEAENTRKRLYRQVEDSKMFGIKAFCVDLLEVSDILNKAVKATPKIDTVAENTAFANLYDGLVMTEDQLKKVFSKHGVAPVQPATGEKFDPNFHEALFRTPVVEGAESNTIFELTKVGYTLNGRVLRPALVGVFSN